MQRRRNGFVYNVIGMDTTEPIPSNENPQVQDKPLVSIILPVKNGHKTITQAVKSVVDQTYRPIEIIVVNEHATAKGEADLSRDLINLLQLEFGGYPFFKIINGLALGPGIARDSGIKEAKGTYVAFLDDDDLWHDPNKLSLQISFLENPANKEIEVVGTATTFFVDENGWPIKTITQPNLPKDVHNQMLLRNPLITSSVVMRKESYVRAGGFKPMYLAEEYDLWLRMGRSGNVIANVPNTSIKYTFHANSLSQKRKIRMAYTVLMLVMENWRYYPHAFIAIIKAKLRILKALF